MTYPEIDQVRMRQAAINQAEERFLREGCRITVYRRAAYPGPRDVTWYVRSDAEGVPEGAAPVYSITPGGM